MFIQWIGHLELLENQTTYSVFNRSGEISTRSALGWYCLLSCGRSIGDSKNDVVATDIDGPSARFKRHVVVQLCAVVYSLRS